MSAPDDRRFHIELFKLLLTVAWSDGRIEAHERARLADLARRWALPEEELAPLVRSLDGDGAGLPPANITLLRERPREVLEAVRGLAASDGVVDGWEESLVQQLAAVLGIPAR